MVPSEGEHADLRDVGCFGRQCGDMARRNKDDAGIRVCALVAANWEDDGAGWYPVKAKMPICETITGRRRV